MLLRTLLAAFFGKASGLTYQAPATPAGIFKGPTAARPTKSLNAKTRKDLGLRDGQPGNKLAVRAAKCAVSLSVIK